MGTNWFRRRYLRSKCSISLVIGLPKFK